PYYTKGPGLYTNFYNLENHHSLSSTIKHYMSNKNWILTYDLSEEIFQMYKEFKYEKYYLNYSVTKPSKGIEYIFYSNGLAVPENTINIKKAN
ncbi:DNA adenine methylase, partial [Streptococcus pyogenes]